MKRKIIEKPWGFEHIWAETDDYVAKMLHIEPRQRLSLQYHENKEETVYVLEGKIARHKSLTLIKCCMSSQIKFTGSAPEKNS